jgi:curli biogenesis system outer membrane secretion channel CsgG
MKNKKTTAAAIALLLLCAAMAAFCKEKPSPAPTPTPSPTASENLAVCARKIGFGGGSGTVISYECRDAEGDSTPCPQNPDALPSCPE